MKKIKITIQKAVYEVDQAVINGLRHMGSLKKLELTHVDKELQDPLNRLFG